MKASKISLMAALIAGVMLAYSPALRAQEAKEGKDTNTRQGRPGGMGMKERVDKMAEDLKLTADQRTKVEAVMKDQAEKRRALRDLTPEERREKSQAMREEMAKKMKEILTAEQFEKWEKNRPQGGPRGQGGPGRGNRQGGAAQK
jgi:periplasmic protein CpxP/Spy